MAKQTEIGEILVRLNVNDANEAVKKLERSASDLRKELDHMGEGDPAARKKLQSQLEGYESDLNKLRQSVKTELRVIINGEVAGKSLRDLKAAAAQVKKEMNLIGENNPEFARKAAQFNIITQEVRKMESSIRSAGAAEGSILALKEKAALLRAEMERLSPATQEFTTKARQLQQVEGQINSLGGAAKGFGGQLKDLAAQFGVIGAGFLAFQQVKQFIQDGVQQSLKLSDALADVRNTTGLTQKEVEKLNDELAKMRTRTSQLELLDIAKVAGQFGVAKDQVAAFVSAVDKSTVVLKSEFKGGAEEITQTLAGLRNVLSDIKSEKIDQDLLHIGNGLITLAQEGVATAPVVADFANRIGGVGISLGLTSDQVLGLSATLQELSVGTERGGTAISKILQKMTTNTEEFAKVAGVSLKDYQKLIDTDIYSAFLKFVEGSRKGGDSAIAFANILKDSEISGVGASEVIAKLNANLPLLEQRTKLAGDALKGTSKITEQAAIKNETFAASAEIIKKAYDNLSADNVFTRVYQKIVNGLASILDLTPKFQKLTDQWKQLNSETQSMTKSMVPLLSRYDELKSKTNKTAAEQDELKKIVEKVAQTIPSAVTEFDKYGTALGINTDKAREFIKAQQTLLAFKNQDAIKETEQSLKQYQGLLDATIRELNDLAKNPVRELTNTRGEFAGYVTVTNNDIQKLSDKIAEYKKQIEGLKLLKKELKGEQLVEDNTPPKKPDDDGKGKPTLTNEQLKKLEEFKEKVLSLDQEIAAAKTQLLESRKEEELVALKTTYDQEIAATGDNNHKRLLLEEKYQIDKTNIEETYGNKIALEQLQQKYQQEREAAQKELRQVENDDKLSADQKKQFADKTTALLLKIDEKYLVDRNNLFAKFSDERREIEFKQDTQNLIDWYNEQKQLTEKQYAEGKISKTTYDKALETLETRTNEYKLQLAKDYGKSIQEIEQLIIQGKIKGYDKDLTYFLNIERDKLELKKKLALESSQESLNITIEEIENERKQKLELYKDDADMRKLINDAADQAIALATQQHLDGLLNMYAGYYSQLASTVQSFDANANTRAQNELTREKKQNDERKKHFQKLLSDKRISQDDYNGEIEKLDQDLADKENELKRKQWRSQHRADIIQSVINTALSVSRALAQPPGPPLTIPFGALAGALGLAQTIAITQQPEPEFEKGKKYGYLQKGKGGLPEGPSHKDGGIDLINTVTGERLGNMEGDEPILSKKTYQNNKDIVDELLHASLYRDGARVDLTKVPLYQKGRDVSYSYEPGFARSAAPVNTTRVIENIIIQKQYLSSTGIGIPSAEGHAVVQAPLPGTSSEGHAVVQKPQQTISPDGHAVVQVMGQVQNQLEVIARILQDPKHRTARLDWYQYREDLANLGKAQNNARIG